MFSIYSEASCFVNECNFVDTASRSLNVALFFFRNNMWELSYKMTNYLNFQEHIYILTAQD